VTDLRWIMRKAFRLIALSLASLGLVSLFIPTASGSVERSAGGLPSLSRSNVITGSGIGVAEVRLAAAASLNVRNGLLVTRGSRSSIRFNGDGRAVGIVLLEDEPDPEQRSLLIWMQTRFCENRGCSGTEASHSWTYEGLERDDERGKVYVPPGDYFLYLIADGAPARVTLRLDGLKGRSHLEPQQQARGGVRTPQVRMDAGPSRQAYWFGEDVSFEGDYGIMYTAMRVEADNWAAGERGFCVYSGQPDFGQLAYSPLCPSGFSYLTPTANVPPVSRQIHEGWFSLHTSRGDAGLGQHLVAAADVSDVDGLFVYLDVDLP
jgi:hypothetical protein